MTNSNLPAALRREEPTPLDQLICWSLADASRATTLSVRKLQQLISSGELPARRVGRRVILCPQAVRDALFGKTTPAE